MNYKFITYLNDLSKNSKLQAFINAHSKPNNFFSRGTIFNRTSILQQISNQSILHDALIQSLNKHRETLANFKFLVGKGWYVSVKVLDLIELSRLSEIANFVNEKNIGDLEKYIISSFDERRPEIFAFLKTKLANRAHIIDEIQALYANGFYHALITLCYTQADGITNEKWGFAFFDSDANDGYNLKVKKLQTNQDTFESLIYHQLQQPKNEMTLNSRDLKFEDKDSREKSINRHLVLHGHSIYYGSKENAIRAILLLEFICDLIKESFHLKAEVDKKNNSNL